VSPLLRIISSLIISILLVFLAQIAGRIVPHEGQIVFQRGSPDSGSAIYRLDVRTALSVNLSRTVRRAEGAASWSPDGQSIVFGFNNRAIAVGYSAGSVGLMDARGRERRTLNRDGGDFPVWSPDGTAIIFAVVDRFFVSVDLMGQTEPVRDLPAWHPLAQRGRLQAARVSPSATDAPEFAQTPEAAPTQTSAPLLPAPEAREGEGEDGAILDLAWSRGGDLVVVAYLDGSLSNLYRLDSRCIPDCAGQLVPIPNTQGALYPALSPDGGRIVYICPAGAGRAGEVCLIGVDGGGRRQLTQSPRSTTNVHPDWRPR
jgi:hypothetical protein